MLQELACARDELLRKINATEQEQEALQQDVLYIMGEQGTTDNVSRQDKNPQTPSWLDWEMSPELSFDSVRSSLDPKSLSGSLDPSSFCTNPDCLTFRMRYEHLIEKIQQFLMLKSQPASEPPSESNTDIKESWSESKEQSVDRFVENEEPESQMLQRITSIHLEHFVRVPKHEESPDDHFIQENAKAGECTENNNSIVDLLVKESAQNAEGHFSENETDEELEVNTFYSDKCEAKKFRKQGKHVNKGRRISAGENDGHFSEEENGELNLARRRHFSDSELTFSLPVNENFKTSQSDNTEGQFVLEQSNTIADNSDSVLALSENKTDADDVFSDEEFKKSENKHVVRKSKSEVKESLENRFLIDEKPPGSGGMTVHMASLPKTGEETGDFFEEKVLETLAVRPNSGERKKSESKPDESFDSGDILEKISHDLIICEKADPILGQDMSVQQEGNENSKQAKVVIASSEMKSYPESDLVARSQSPRRDFVDAPVLKSDVPSSASKFDKGQRSYENAVFDILNSICPGTDPHRRPGVRTQSDTFHPLLQDMANTTEEFSDLPVETDYKELLVQYENIKQTLNETLKENTELKCKQMKKEDIQNQESQTYFETLKENQTLQEELDLLKTENEELKRTVTDLEKENTQIKVSNEYTNGKSYDDLDKENSFLKENIACLNDDITFVTEEIELKVHEINRLQDQLYEAKNKHQKMLSKLEEVQKDKANFENLLVSENKDCESLKGTLQTCEKELETMKDSNIQLSTKLSELQLENESLKLDKMKCDVLAKEQDSLKSQVNNLKAEKDELLKILEEDKCKVLTEKEELEKALLAHDDINRELEAKLGEVTAENEGLIKMLQNEKQSKLDLKDKENQLNELIQRLKIDKEAAEDKCAQFDFETKKTLEEKEKGDIEIRNLKSEKEELNSKLKELEAEITTLQRDNDCKSERISELCKENETLTQQVKTLKCHVSQLEPQIVKLSNEVKNLKGKNVQVMVTEKEVSAKDNQIDEELNVLDEKYDQEYFRERVESFDRATDTTEIEKEWIKHKFKEWQKHEKELSGDTEIESGSSYTLSLDKTDIQETSDLMSLKEELEMLKTENVALKERIDSIDARSDSDTDLQILQDMREAIKTLKTEKDAIVRQKSEVSDSLEKDQKRLQAEVEELLVENDALRRNMKIKEETLRKENMEIVKMYDDLRNEVEVLVISKHDLEIELHALKDLLEHESSVAQERIAEHDTSKELTLKDLEDMEGLKSSIEKLKSDLKEKDNYVRKLEEHLLGSEKGIPSFASTPKPLLSRGNPLLAKALFRRTSLTNLARKAFSQDIPFVSDSLEEASVRNTAELPKEEESSLQIEELASSVSSERKFVKGIGRQGPRLTSSLLSSMRDTSFSDSFSVSDKIRSGLKSDEDGHLALELKQYELVAEIAKLRRDLRETKAVYTQETSLLTEALEKEKLSKELRTRSGSFGDHSLSSNISHDLLKLRKEVAVMKEENKLLKIDNDRWLERLKEQEAIVCDLKERLGRNTSGYGEIEEVFGRQLALLQKQREELVDKLKDKELQISSLSIDLGEKGIIEESLRKEKNILTSKLEDRDKLEKELNEKKMLLEKQSLKQRELENVIYRKDLSEIELMKQKRLLEEELKDIESKFRDKEENLDYEKNKLLGELREKHVRSRSLMSESDDDISSSCSESAMYSDRNISHLELMLEEVEKQHAVAVNVLKDQLRTKYSRREKELRKDHEVGLAKLKSETNRQVN